MAFGKKRNTASSSRYSREDAAQQERGNAPHSRRSLGRDDSYGVRDSYSRQASYGKPDGYYDSREDVPRRAAADDRSRRGTYDRRYNDGWGDKSDRDYDSGYDASSDVRYGGRGGDYVNGKYDENYDDRYDDSYDDRYDGNYDDRYDESYDENYGSSYDDGYDADYRDTRRQQGKRKAGSGKARGAGQRKKGKAGFAVKLILLVLAAGVLFLFWRFSRMDRTHLTDILKNAGVASQTGYQNFAIYGVDSREGQLTKDAHSDTIIICSLNKKTKEIKMVSVYRDTYLDNTNGEYRKAAECYFFGGPGRSINMLNKNLDLDIEDYVTVGFDAVIKAVDLIGGVDIEVTEEELPYINGYQTENSQVTGAQITPVNSAGFQTLNGIQALAYCRIRYTAGSDYKRTERQRDVLSQIFSKAQQQGVTKLAQVIDSMLPEISTSFSNAELLSLASGISGYTLSESTGFPFELQAANISAGDCVVPVNLAQNVSQLHAYLFGDEGYTPSQTVQDISNQIINTTGIQ